MARSEVVQAISNHLAANWIECQIVEENDGAETPKDASPFVMVQYPYCTSERITFGSPGSNWHRESGAFIINVNIKRGSGTDLGRAWADRLADLFRGQTFGTLRIGAPDSARTDDQNDAGNYFRLKFAVPYRFDYVG